MQINRTVVGPDGKEKKELTFLGKYLFVMAMIGVAGVVLGTIAILFHFIHGLAR